MDSKGTNIDYVLADPVAPVDADTAQFAKGRLTNGAFAMKVVYSTLILVVLFTGFVAVFFFLLASQVEKEVVNTSTTTFVAGIMADLETYLPPAQIVKIKAVLSTLQVPDFSKQDQSVQKTNASLKKTTGIVLGILGGSVALFIVILYLSYKAGRNKIMGGRGVTGVDWPDMGHVLAVSATCFGGVALAEITFLYLIAKRYQPLNGNAVKKAVLDQIIANINAMPAP
jgi:predicted PurR-regulated permease PerM